jgi:hypothetical protein
VEDRDGANTVQAEEKVSGQCPLFERAESEIRADPYGAGRVRVGNSQRFAMSSARLVGYEGVCDLRGVLVPLVAGETP